MGRVWHQAEEFNMGRGRVNKPATRGDTRSFQPGYVFEITHFRLRHASQLSWGLSRRLDGGGRGRRLGEESAAVTSPDRVASRSDMITAGELFPCQCTACDLRIIPNVIYGLVPMRQVCQAQPKAAGFSDCGDLVASYIGRLPLRRAAGGKLSRGAGCSADRPRTVVKFSTRFITKNIAVFLDNVSNG